MPPAAIPDHDGAAPIFSLRDGAFELVVFDRMIFHLDGQPLLAGYEARTAGHRPALHHTVELEPQIVMQAARSVLLDDELIALGPCPATTRLRRHIELTLLAIDLYAHVRRPQLTRPTRSVRGKSSQISGAPTSY